MTRKLRRRPNDPVPEKVEKRRKPPPAQLNYLLDEKEIESDLKAISRGKVLTTIRKPGTDQKFQNNVHELTGNHYLQQYYHIIIQ